MINVSGFKVWPAEVENYLYQIPQIREVAVFGIPDPLKGESVCAAVVLKDGAQLTPEYVIDWCREKLAACADILNVPFSFHPEEIGKV